MIKAAAESHGDVGRRQPIGTREYLTNGHRLHVRNQTVAEIVEVEVDRRTAGVGEGAVVAHDCGLVVTCWRCTDAECLLHPLSRAL